MSEDKKKNRFYQNVNFHFSVHFDTSEDSPDIRFQSVSGLDSTMETETIKEGGENRFEHVLPLRRKYGPLILKRGLLKPSQSEVTKWLKKVFDDEIIEPWKSVDISLLDEEHKKIMTWTVDNVWPRSWKVGDLDAMKGEILIETLELNYNRLIFKG